MLCLDLSSLRGKVSGKLQADADPGSSSDMSESSIEAIVGRIDAEIELLPETPEVAKQIVEYIHHLRPTASSALLCEYAVGQAERSLAKKFQTHKRYNNTKWWQGTDSFNLEALLKEGA